MLNKKNYLSIAVAAFLLLTILFAVSYSLSYNPLGITCYLDSPWTVNYNDKTYTDMNFKNINDLTANGFIKKDVISLTTNLKDVNEDFPCLFFTSKYSAFIVSLTNLKDGTSFDIYSYDYDRYKDSDFVGCDYHLINLPEDYENYELTITIYVNSDTEALPISMPTLSTYHNQINSYINDHIYALCIGIFAVVFGISFLFISLMFIGVSKNSKIEILTGLFCLDIGIWLLSYYGLLDFFYESRNTTFMSYITMFLILPITYLIIDTVHPAKNKLFFSAVSFINIFIPIELVMLHLNRTVYFNESRGIFFITALITFLILTNYLVKDIKTIHKTRTFKSASNRLQLYGLFCFAWCGIFEIATFSLHIFSEDILLIIKNITLPTGIAIYIGTVIFNYIIFSTEGLARVQQYNKLKEMAYVDVLTKLPNRAVSDYLMKRYGNSTSNYCIISIDINGLKSVNDTYGHTEGDRLIKDFANCLSENFEDVGVCTRMGGDEFLIYIDSIKEVDLKKRLINLEESYSSLDGANEKGIRHSFAYGYAFKNNLENSSPHTVYMVADQLMYDMKRKQHEQRQDQMRQSCSLRWIVNLSVQKLLFLL